MKEVLRQRARELGFDDCRVTTAIAPESVFRFTQWLADHRHGDMAYLERTAPKRVDPQQVLPGARSVITLAASYHDPNAPTAPASSNRALWGAPAPLHKVRPSNGKWQMANGTVGLIARYARYRDYHDVLGERLKQLTEFVNESGGGGTRSLWYVDTGPLLERPGWASSASIPISSAANWATGSSFRKSSPRWHSSRMRRRRTAAAHARAASPLARRRPSRPRSDLMRGVASPT